MNKHSHPMPNFWRHTVAVALASLVAACGGGGGGSVDTGGSGPTNLPLSSKIVVEDAAIVNALITDSAGRTATMTGRGEYQFIGKNDEPLIPVLPILVSSRNVLVNGSIPNGVPVTFQDMDRNGVYSPGDIAFNGNYYVRYAVRGNPIIYVNPVAALIPAGWSGNTAIAGLSPTVLQSAVNSRIETSSSSELKQATALLTALSDTLAMNLSSKGMENTKISSVVSNLLVAVGVGAGVNLLDANAASNLGMVAAATVTAASASIPPGNLASAVSNAANLGTNLQNLSVASVKEPIVNYESIVQVAQNSASLATNSYDVGAGVSNVKNTDVTIQNARAVAINSLRVVPFCDLMVGQSAACNPAVVGPWLAFDRLTGFGMISQANGSITVSGAGDLFTGFSFASGIRAEFRSSSNSWKYVQPNVSSTLEISLGVSFKDPNNTTQTGNLMTICNAAGSCVPYYLATASGVCNLVTTNNNVNQSLLAKINALNAQQTSCPASPT